MESVCIKPGVAIAVLAGLMELIGGALFAIGWLTPLAAVLITTDSSIVAYRAVWG
jgi:putative oxidoreductase